MTQIQKADPDARRMFVVGTLLGVCAIAALGYFEPGLQCWLRRNIETLLRNPTVLFICLLLASPLLLAALYCLFLGNCIVRSRRFPPPGQPV